VALKAGALGVLYYEDALPLGALLAEAGAMDGHAFLAAWRALPTEASASMPAVAVADVAAVEAQLKAARLFLLAHRPVPGTGQEALYVAGRLDAGGLAHPLLLELRFTRGAPGLEAACKCERADIAPLAFDALRQVLGGGQ
jgi:hypothetical protein